MSMNEFRYAPEWIRFARGNWHLEHASCQTSSRPDAIPSAVKASYTPVEPTCQICYEYWERHQEKIMDGTPLRFTRPESHLSLDKRSKARITVSFMAAKGNCVACGKKLVMLRKVYCSDACGRKVWKPRDRQTAARKLRESQMDEARKILAEMKARSDKAALA